ERRCRPGRAARGVGRCGRPRARLVRGARRAVGRLEGRVRRREPQLPPDLLQRRPRAVDQPGPRATRVPVRRRPPGRRRAGRHLRVPRADRGVHLGQLAARRRPHVVPARVDGAAAAVRPAHRLAPARAGRPPGAAVVLLPGAGALRPAQLGPAGRRGRHRRAVVLGPRADVLGRGAARRRRLPEDLSRALPAPAGGGAPGPLRSRRRPADRCRRPRGRRGGQPALRPRRPRGVGGDVRLPVGPGGRLQQQQRLVLGAARPDDRAAERARAGPGRRGGPGRRRLGRGPGAPGGRLPRGAGLRRGARGVPARQQGELPAVHAVAPALLRAAARALGLVGGVHGRGRPGLRRGLPVVLRPGQPYRPGAAGGGAARRRVVEVRPAAGAVPAAAAGVERRAPPTPAQPTQRPDV
ncbi:MAG: possible membrane protein, partial [uncultured Frankineae bacterium]